MRTLPKPFEPPETSQGNLQFRPQPAPIRGMLYAYLAAFLAVVAALILGYMRTRIPLTLVAFAGLFLLAGLLISYSRWMDANTCILLSPEALEYRNPIRKTHLAWDAVEEMHILQAGPTWRVLVAGETGSFQFRVSRQGEQRSGASYQLGLPQAERLVRLVRGMAGLDHVEQQEETWIVSHHPTQSP